MKTPLAGNLVATFTEFDKKYQPTIDDGEMLYVFDAYNYSGKENAVRHAQGTIDSLQTTLNNVVASWPVKARAK